MCYVGVMQIGDAVHAVVEFCGFVLDVLVGVKVVYFLNIFGSVVSVCLTL
jgi:hypothetical protein